MNPIDHLPNNRDDQYVTAPPGEWFNFSKPSSHWTQLTSLLSSDDRRKLSGICLEMILWRSASEKDRARRSINFIRVYHAGSLAEMQQALRDADL